jgi:hypothetical protein
MEKSSKQRQLAPWRFPVNQAVRGGLVTATLLASLAGIAAPAASGQDPARPAADPSLAQGSGPEDQAIASDEQIVASDEQAVTSQEQAAGSETQAPGADEKRGHRPPPPPALATFTGVVAVGRTRYTYTMVGSNPALRRARNVVVPVAILPMRLEFADGTVLDPTQPDACLGGRVPLAVTLQSPLFQDFDYGQGPRQFLEQIRRMEFWQLTGPGKLNPGYSVRLAPSVLPTQTLALSPASVTQQVACLATGGSQTMGHIEGDDFNNFVQDQVVAQFPKWGVNASTFVLILIPFVDFTTDGVETGVSYHSILDTPQGVVTYAVAQLGLAKPGNLVNIGPQSHELAEWLDDPYGENPTPPWGNTGQVTSGCAPVLEVGDPLTGTFLKPILMPNGLSYQPQETAFFSWFYDQVPSLGFDGWYSSGGTFKTPAAPCH